MDQPPPRTRIQWTIQDFQKASKFLASSHRPRQTLLPVELAISVAHSRPIVFVSFAALSFVRHLWNNLQFRIVRPLYTDWQFRKRIQHH
mmetsp:Transcript_16411/g.28432  ORF Transcript_16411/g.28432 Transcript_16411/m.28432 type:complete len:89 (-) Transcript_16411:355-621(-)